MSLVTTFNPFGSADPGWKAYPSNLTDGIVATYYGNNKYFAQTVSKIYYSLDGFSWSQCTVPSGVYTGGTLLWCDNKYVIVGRRGVLINYGIYSYDGITWTKFNFPETKYFNTFCYGNGIYVAIIENAGAFTTNNYFYSTNGINWTKYELSERIVFSNIAFNNGVFVIVTFPSTGNTNYFFSSTDGINWTPRLVTQGIINTSDNYNNNNNKTTHNDFYVFGSGVYFTSNNGISWVKHQHVAGSSSDFFLGGRWIHHRNYGDYNLNEYTTFRLNYEDVEGSPKYIKNGYQFVSPIYNPDINKYFTIAINEPIVAFY